jgi:hypothetical protein
MHRGQVEAPPSPNPSRFNPKLRGAHRTWGGGELRSRSGRVWQILLQLGFEFRTFRHAVSRYTDWAIPAAGCYVTAVNSHTCKKPKMFIVMFGKTQGLWNKTLCRLSDFSTFRKNIEFSPRVQRSIKCQTRNPLIYPLLGIIHGPMHPSRRR